MPSHFFNQNLIQWCPTFSLMYYTFLEEDPITLRCISKFLTLLPQMIKAIKPHVLYKKPTSHLLQFWPQWLLYESCDTLHVSSSIVNLIIDSKIPFANSSIVELSTFGSVVEDSPYIVGSTTAFTLLATLFSLCHCLFVSNDRVPTTSFQLVFNSRSSFRSFQSGSIISCNLLSCA